MQTTILNKKETKAGTIYLVLVNGVKKWVHESKLDSLVSNWNKFLSR